MGRTAARFLVALLVAAALWVPAAANPLGIPDTEYGALVALYNSLDGPNWTQRGNWLTAAKPWFGVTVEAGHVTAIALNGNGLSGGLPAQIGGLPNLTYLDLGTNAISGPIPAQIGSLSEMTCLYLGDNRLTGSIPAELGGLSRLEELDLGGNQLAGAVPEWLGGVPGLSHLDLGSNQFTGEIPSAIGSLLNLQVLNLRENQLTGPIPSEIGGLYELAELDLGCNRLSGGIPAWISSLSNLLYLDLGGNLLTGQIPAEIGYLYNLSGLYLDGNQLSGPMPAELGNLWGLWSLDLSHNELSGPIPAEIGRLSNLHHLDLGSNGFTGPIPAEIGSLLSLDLLDLSQNQLSGTIPTALGALPNLWHLALSSNGLTGPIPEEIYDLTNLWHMDFSGNRLTGSLPAKIGRLANLGCLDLGGNLLTGAIPTAIGGLENLTELDLSANQFSGQIPAQLCDIAGLTSLRLSRNRLTGAIPEQIGLVPGLRTLELEDNRLDGAVPDAVCGLTELATLRLGRNRLAGQIPTGLAYLSKLLPAGEGETIFGYNALFSDDPALDAFLQAKDPGWDLTQTVAPAGVLAKPAGSGSAAVSWIPIAYTSDPGRYELGFGASPYGPFTFPAANRTTSKTASSMPVAGLPAGAVYVVVRTLTPAHGLNQSDVTSLPSLPSLVAPTPSAGMPKLTADFAPVVTTPAAVTAVFGADFYIEDPLRTWGIRARLKGHGLSEGDLTQVRGTVRTAGTGERYIEAASAPSGDSAEVGPLGVPIRALCGTGWRFDPGTAIGQMGMAGGFGLNTVGLLVRTWGTVTQTGAGYLYIDDGSGLRDGTLSGSEENVGVRIKCDPAGYSRGMALSVTGASSCFCDAAGLHPLIRPAAVAAQD